MTKSSHAQNRNTNSYPNITLVWVEHDMADRIYLNHDLSTPNKNLLQQLSLRTPATGWWHRYYQPAIASSSSSSTQWGRQACMILPEWPQEIHLICYDIITFYTSNKLSREWWNLQPASTGTNRNSRQIYTGCSTGGNMSQNLHWMLGTTQLRSTWYPWRAHTYTWKKSDIYKDNQITLKPDTMPDLVRPLRLQ